MQGLSWVMRESLKKTTIKKEVSLHSLRHTFATHLLEEGTNIVTLKELLGHSDIVTVHQLSDTFRGKFLDILERTLRKCNMPHSFDACIRRAYQKPWVVFSEGYMAKAEHVVRYL